MSGRGPATAGPNSQLEIYIAVEHEDFRTPLLLPEVLPQATVVATVNEPGGA